MNARSGFAKAEIARKGRANYVPPLAKLGFWRVILDESHVIKEENTAMAKAVRMLSAHRRWCVSGTPAPILSRICSRSSSSSGVIPWRRTCRGSSIFESEGSIICVSYVESKSATRKNSDS